MWLRKALLALPAKPNPNTPNALIRNHSTTRHKLTKLQKTTKGRKCSQASLGTGIGKNIRTHSRCHIPFSPTLPYSSSLSVLVFFCLSASFLLQPSLLILLAQGCPDMAPSVPSFPCCLHIDDLNPDCWKKISLAFFGSVVYPRSVTCGSDDTEDLTLQNQTKKNGWMERKQLVEEMTGNSNGIIIHTFLLE